MTNTVLSTIDVENEHVRESSRGPGKNVMSLMTRLYAELQGKGVDFQIYRPRYWRVKKEERHLDDWAKAADVIFHDNQLLQSASVKSAWHSKHVTKKICEEYIHKSHNFADRNKLRMAGIMKAAGIPVPETMSVKDYMESERRLPAVLKPRYGSLGRGVYYIDRPELIGCLFEEGVESPIKLPKNRYLVQEFIHSPGDRINTYRVLTVGDEIIGCVINARSVNMEEMYSQRELKSTEQLLYMMRRSNSIASNAKGCIEIPVSHQPQKPIKWGSSVLTAHGIDPENVGIPPGLESLAITAGRELTKHGYVYAGQDWMMDRKGNFYFLEANPLPNMYMFNTLFLGKKAKRREYRNHGIARIADALKRYSPPSESFSMS